jgi:hypothetical protein
MKTAFVLVALAMAAGSALAKLPAPEMTDEAKAKAAEAAAKTAHAGKVSAYQLCVAQDRVAARYHAEAKKAGNDMAPIATPPCVNPGPFVYTAAAAK